MAVRLSRRSVIYKCLASGVLVAYPALGRDGVLAWLEAEELAATPRVGVGPFFRRGAPERRQLVPEGAAGLPLQVTGRVVDTHGRGLPEARIEVWHADHFGEYDLAGYNCRGALRPDAQAAYAYDTVLPGHYPARVAQHIHYLATAPGCRPLSTQLYFATDPVFEGDPARRYKVDPLVISPELIRPVLLDPKSDRRTEARVSFELVLERL